MKKIAYIIIMVLVMMKGFSYADSMAGMNMGSMDGMSDGTHIVKPSYKLGVDLKGKVDKLVKGIKQEKLEKLSDEIVTMKTKIMSGKLTVKDQDMILALLDYIGEKTNEKINISGIVQQKIYIANEGDSSITVIDAKTTKVIKSIDLTQELSGDVVKYSAHNVQVSPDGKIVAVTANVIEGSEHHDENEMENSKFDQMIFIDPMTDKIKTRVNIDKGAHLAHVVMNNDSSIAYFVSQQKSKLYKLSLNDFKLIDTIDFLSGSQPHGIRLSKDGNSLYVAFMGNQSLGVFETKTNSIHYYPLGDKAVQAAVTPNNEYAFASLYTTKRVARYNISDKSINYIDLPKDAKGPIQIYPTPDSNYIYVADQGYYFNQLTGNQIYKIDIKQAKVVDTLTGGEGPHGVVVSPDGNYVYVTNLLSNTLSIIDAKTDSVLKSINIGKTPNGISIWTKGIGGTP